MSVGAIASTTFAVVGYATCSSLMLVINKVAVHHLPAPSFVLLAQVTCSWVAVKAAGVLGFIEVDEMEWVKLRSFFPVAAAFLACIYTNIKTLQYANVETFIVFRASTPLLIGVCEWAIMGRELPNLRSALAMLALVVGACGYVLFDASFVVHGYIWVGVWYAIFCFDQLYIKHAVDTTPMRSNWGRVFYTNLWASLMLCVMTALLEPDVFTSEHFHWRSKGVMALAVSCAAGVAMSYFAFLCRAAVSATSFTVIGNVCKILTVLINISIWDKHASPPGLAALLVCLAAAAAYQQAPLRRDAPREARVVEMSTTKEGHAGLQSGRGDEEEEEGLAQQAP